MAYIALSVYDEHVNRRPYTDKKSGERRYMCSQEAWATLNGTDPHPTKVKLSLAEDESPFPAGDYQWELRFRTNQYDEPVLDTRDLRLKAVADSKKAVNS